MDKFKKQIFTDSDFFLLSIEATKLIDTASLNITKQTLPVGISPFHHTAGRHYRVASVI
jgi:hypothetical protein